MGAIAEEERMRLSDKKNVSIPREFVECELKKKQNNSLAVNRSREIGKKLARDAFRSKVRGELTVKASQNRK